MSAATYGRFMLKNASTGILGGTLAATNLKAMICQAGYVANLDSHEFRSSVTNEVSGTGYTAGGIVLSGVTVTLDSTTHRVVIGASPADFGTVTFSNGTQLIVYVNTGSAATDRLVSVHAFPTAQSRVAQNFTYSFASTGIAYGSYT